MNNVVMFTMLFISMELTIPIYIFWWFKNLMKISFLNHQNIIMVFSMFYPLLMLLNMCIHSHITSCSCSQYDTFCMGIEMKIFLLFWFHYDQILNITILAHIRILITHMMWNSHATWDFFKFLKFIDQCSSIFQCEIKFMNALVIVY
jgi:hypothetical protein